ncbi:hypothetical protein KA057_02155, partial [Candidatus Gracilibacteria bacterium]|nr:hypothetical protein [Candidatus Gracilibacteria bacterium]
VLQVVVVDAVKVATTVVVTVVVEIAGNSRTFIQNCSERSSFFVDKNLQKTLMKYNGNTYLFCSSLGNHF